jgi:hypothetical protein
MPQVLLRDRSQQGDEHAESSEDVDDREDLRPCAGRAEVTVANSRQRRDREIERFDDGPVLEAPEKIVPGSTKAPATAGNALVSGSRRTAHIARASPRKAKRR